MFSSYFENERLFELHEAQQPRKKTWFKSWRTRPCNAVEKAKLAEVNSIFDFLIKGVRVEREAFFEAEALLDALDDGLHDIAKRIRLR